MAKWSRGSGQTKNGSKTPMKKLKGICVTRPGGIPGPSSEARPGGRYRQRAPGGRAYHARKGNVDTSSPPRWPTTRGWKQWGRVRCNKGGSYSRRFGRTDSGQRRLTFGTWNVTTLLGKEPELVREVEPTSWIWWGSPPHIARTLDPNSWTRSGPCSFLELPRV